MSVTGDGASDIDQDATAVAMMAARNVVDDETFSSKLIDAINERGWPAVVTAMAVWSEIAAAAMRSRPGAPGVKLHIPEREGSTVLLGRIQLRRHGDIWGLYAEDPQGRMLSLEALEKRPDHRDALRMVAASANDDPDSFRALLSNYMEPESALLDLMEVAVRLAGFCLVASGPTGKPHLA